MIRGYEGAGVWGYEDRLYVANIGDYVSRSMQNLCAIHFAICGGSTLMRGSNPISANSLL